MQNTNNVSDYFDNTEVKIPSDLKDFILDWKEKPGNLIMVLHRVQETYGFIPLEVAKIVAKVLNVSLAKIYGVITFYHFFNLKKPGKYKISVCIGTACYLKGANDLIEEIQSRLGIKVGETTKDELFTLETVRCIGCCGLAPVITINEDVYGNLKKDQITEILGKYT